jgi:hypothetical protein
MPVLVRICLVLQFALSRVVCLTHAVRPLDEGRREQRQHCQGDGGQDTGHIDHLLVHRSPLAFGYGPSVDPSLTGVKPLAKESWKLQARGLFQDL